MAENLEDIQVGDKVIVAEHTRQKYRPDLIEVEVVGITKSPKIVKYHLSDGSSVFGKNKIRKIN